MKRRTRRILFISAIAIFILCSYVAILYAQGYKYSFRDNKFVRTGAIYLDVNTSAKVYFNDKLVGSTSFIGNAFSKGGLLPGQYMIRITRDGYTTWQKKTIVEEGFVIDFPKVMILPENEEERAKLIVEIEGLLNSAKPELSPTPKIKIPSPTPNFNAPFYLKDKILYKNEESQKEIIDRNVQGFVVSQNESRIAWWNNNNEIWVMWLRDTGYQPYHKDADKELLTRFSTKIKNIGWFRDEDHIVVDSLGYKIVELDTRGGINIIKL